jgi:hypothetical protein
VLRIGAAMEAGRPATLARWYVYSRIDRPKDLLYQWCTCVAVGLVIGDIGFRVQGPKL